MMDWLGSIGGIRDILMEMLSAFFGGYCAFNATLQTFGKMSVLELKDDGSGEIMSEEQKIIAKIGTIESIFMYFVT